MEIGSGSCRRHMKKGPDHSARALLVKRPRSAVERVFDLPLGDAGAAVARAAVDQVLQLDVVAVGGVVLHRHVADDARDRGECTEQARAAEDALRRLAGRVAEGAVVTEVALRGVRKRQARQGEHTGGHAGRDDSSLLEHVHLLVRVRECSGAVDFLSATRGSIADRDKGSALTGAFKFRTTIEWSLNSSGKLRA